MSDSVQLPTFYRLVVKSIKAKNDNLSLKNYIFFNWNYITSTRLLRSHLPDFFAFLSMVEDKAQREIKSENEKRFFENALKMK